MKYYHKDTEVTAIQFDGANGMEVCTLAANFGLRIVSQIPFGADTPKVELQSKIGAFYIVGVSDWLLLRWHNCHSVLSDKAFQRDYLKIPEDQSPTPDTTVKEISSSTQKLTPIWQVRVLGSPWVEISSDDAKELLRTRTAASKTLLRMVYDGREVETALSGMADKPKLLKLVKQLFKELSL